MTGFNTVVTLSCFCQINADVEMRSTQMITEDTLGVLAFVQKVISAIQFWNPQDFDPASPTYQDTYLREPARMTDGGFGLTNMEIGDSFWTNAPIDVEMKFTAKFPG